MNCGKDRFDTDGQTPCLYHAHLWTGPAAAILGTVPVFDPPGMLGAVLPSDPLHVLPHHRCPFRHEAWYREGAFAGVDLLRPLGR